MRTSVTVETARGGQPVVKRDGRWLASSFDPVREGMAWAKKIVSQVRADEQVFVFGLGSGYHVTELAKLLPRDQYLVFEESREVAARVFEICPELREESTIVEPEWTRIVESTVFRDRLPNVISVAKYGPSVQMQDEYYKNIERLLIGRDRLSFLLQLKARPGIWSILDADKIAAFTTNQASTECISIKTLQRLFAEHAVNARERQMWRVLEELVA